jgi:ATP/maltotriose-dependent transcriptional regulator MalT
VAVATLEVARAEALLALGEPFRALAVLTPVPTAAVVEGSVTVAAACLEIGDLRGAEAVLSGVRERLEVASLGTQLQAWLLEARIAEQRDRPERAVHLVDRALRSASYEDMRAPLRREWSWLRQRVERNPFLDRTYRDFLRLLQGADVIGPAVQEHRSTRALRTDEVKGVQLTRRETEVLDLLTRMYSTDEIAEALFVSANTVKTHLKGLYAKLCVSRRADAVRRGRQLGLC